MVVGLGEDFVDKVDEVAFGLGFAAVVTRLVGFGGALKTSKCKFRALKTKTI